KRVGVVSVGKISAVTGAIMGLVFAVLFSVFAVSAVGQSAGGIFGFGLLSIVLLPIFYAVLGLIFGMIYALVYNLAAKWVGGIEMELQDKVSS
ncbi:MAG TPA: DUF3566 domain-containing protein, partial [Candidatus Paceibacterota bacterium]